MKVLDDVILKIDRDLYKKQGIFVGMQGTIISAEIRNNEFLVCFQDQKAIQPDFIWNDENIKALHKDIVTSIKIEDLEVIKEGNATHSSILEELPNQDLKWWCKVEGGYIVNLLGEKKNKVPYDYNS